MRYLNIAAILLTVAIVAAPVSVAADTGASATDSAKTFVQSFYDWYMAQTKKTGGEPPEELALKDKRQSFDASLVKALDEDLAAAAKSPDEIVGLDFDPFLNAQDDCSPYKVGKATRVRDAYQVEIFGSCSGDDHKRPDVIAEIKKLNGSWIFVNFIYPGNGDLLSVLQDLKKERQSEQGAPQHGS